MKEVNKAFKGLKTAFTIVLILRYFDPILKIYIEINASRFIIIGMIS
jgi:hypothetical protein